MSWAATSSLYCKSCHKLPIRFDARKPGTCSKLNLPLLSKALATRRALEVHNVDQGSSIAHYHITSIQQLIEKSKLALEVIQV